MRRHEIEQEAWERIEGLLPGKAGDQRPVAASRLAPGAWKKCLLILIRAPLAPVCTPSCATIGVRYPARTVVCLPVRRSVSHD